MLSTVKPSKPYRLPKSIALAKCPVFPTKAVFSTERRTKG